MIYWNIFQQHKSGSDKIKSVETIFDTFLVCEKPTPVAQRAYFYRLTVMPAESFRIISLALLTACV